MGKFCQHFRIQSMTIGFSNLKYWKTKRCVLYGAYSNDNVPVSVKILLFSLFFLFELDIVAVIV